jgi:hydrogenase maturation protease
MKKPILVLGIGNILLSDEGVGVHVVQKLREMSLPPEVELMDGGTMGIDLMFSIEGRKKVIVIDVVATNDPPGSIYRFTDRELAENSGVLQSVHGINFPYVIKNVTLFGTPPDHIVFIGIKPADINEGLELTPEIAAKVPKIIEIVMKEIQ